MSGSLLTYHVDEQIEHRAEARLRGRGLTIADAFVIFLTKVADDRIPEDILTSPETTERVLSIAVPEDVLNQSHVVVREPHDTDETYEARKNMFATVLTIARTRQ